jgi:hypothetical protein
MNGEQRGNWWKAASSQQQYAMFKKLMRQAIERDDKGKHMEGLVLSGRAPPWLTEHLAEWMMNSKNEPFPEWTIRWAGTQLSQEGRNPLLDYFREYMFDPERFWTPGWAQIWGISLASRPDDIPAWLERKLEFCVNAYGNVPHWAYAWAESKLRSGKMDGMRKELEDMAIYRWRHGMEKLSWYSPHLKRLITDMGMAARNRNESQSQSYGFDG